MPNYNQGKLYNSNNYYNDTIALGGASNLSVTVVTISVGNANINSTSNLQATSSVINISSVNIRTNANIVCIGAKYSYNNIIQFSVESIVKFKGKVLRIVNTFDDYIKAVKSNTGEPVYRLEFLDNDENVISVITPDLIDGSLSLTYQNGSRRSLNMSFVNNDGEYIPVPETGLWVNSKFRLYSGLKVNSQDYIFSRGIFVLSEPELSSNFAEKTANINAIDKWAMLDGTLAGELPTDYIIPVGTNIETAVRLVFSDAGEIKPVIIDSISEVTPYTITKEAGSTYADILIELAEMLSYQCYYNENGYPVFTKPLDEDNEPVKWNYNDNEILYLGSTHSYKFSDIRNTVIVIGDNINGSLVRQEVSDTNALSPTRISLIGKRTRVIRDDLIYNNTLALGRANYELKNLITIFESVNVQSMPIDIIQEGNIITIDDISNDLKNDRYVVQTVDFPLRYDGTMQMSIWKNRKIS